MAVRRGEEEGLVVMKDEGGRSGWTHGWKPRVGWIGSFVLPP